MNKKTTQKGKDMMDPKHFTKNVQDIGPTSQTTKAMFKKWINKSKTRKCSGHGPKRQQSKNVQEMGSVIVVDH